MKNQMVFTVSKITGTDQICWSYLKI